MGHRGVEPRCLTGRPRRPAGSWPAEGEGVEPHGLTAATGFQGQLPQPAAHLPSAESGGTEPHRLATAARFRNGACHPAGSLSMEEDGELESQGLPTPTRFPDGDHHPVVSSPVAESGEIESHGVTRALVSSEARSLIGSLSMITRTVPRIRTANLLGLSQAPLPNWARTAWSDRRDSNSPCNLGKVAC